MELSGFEKRHIGPNLKEINAQLQAIGVDNIEALIAQTVPDSIRMKKPLNLPEGIDEHVFLKHLHDLAEKNKLYETFIGLGYHAAITPAVIQRNILENPGWYTAYTPYQAEIAQGRLEAIFNFQTVVSDLTGMELANASLLDESTAAAEGMTMLFSARSREQKKQGAVRFFVDENILPQTLSLLQTRALPLGIELVEGNWETIAFDATYYGAILQYPGKHGAIPDIAAFATKAQDAGMTTVIAADLLSLCLLEAPSTYGVDVVVGTTQRFGIPLGYGGPHAAFFATKEIYKRNIPGRIIGQTIDMDENPALRMALQTREQHIKRDRATSNICTAQVLLAVMAGMYAVYHGPEGLKSIAQNIHRKTQALAQALSQMGYRLQNTSYFDTLSIACEADSILNKAWEQEMNFLKIDDQHVGIAINETTTLASLNRILTVFETASAQSIPVKELPITGVALPQDQMRQTPYLTHPVFNAYHSESSLMRYIKSLERKDLSLTHSMISLGSCTMKLNAAAEMLPLSWAKWGNLHPFVPLIQAQGYQTVLQALEKQLNEITGFAATSLQPNSGAQGEYAGLMVIRAYHQSRGDHHRNICLIPASAHGTNPASAVMAGMQVVVTKTDEKGNIDWEDIFEKVHQHKENLAALMITYPSTHGVFESHIQEITQLIHACGGQVYMDGANMNAQVGITSPAIIGADVCHLNLHKTFAIPHGGGGPGVGPICVAEHLKDFLPGNPVIPTGGSASITAISAAPWGSALACLISYGYIKMLGAAGLQKATQIAILNSNYIQERLKGAYEVLYTGEKGRSAHELIIDCRPFKANHIEVTDIAKRLMDYGFHAPTVSFPVPGTMMIEPTESENKAEIDRFCEAMLSIRKEIDAPTEEEREILKNAPHTLAMITQDAWPYPYSRQQAAFPLPFVRENKFWPSVRRVDEAFGDRNLICSCVPVSEYESSEY